LIQRPLRCNPALVEHDDPVGASQYGLTMRHNEAGRCLIRRQTIPQQTLRLDIKGAGDIIADE